jgi:cytochrome c2
MKPLFLLALFSVTAFAADPSKKPTYPPQPWAAWVEPDFPFFSSILDARREGVGENNLTPRGIILKLDHECWACFDTDLLRVSAIWRGKGITDKALAPGSYLDAGRKTPGGQFPAPQLDGKLWLGNGLFPGWQSGDNVSMEDPREPAPSKEEVGRGPVTESIGRFRNVRLVNEGVVLEYSASGADVREWWKSSENDGRPVVERHISVSAAKKPLLLVVGAKMNGPSQEVEAGVTVTGDAELLHDDDLWIVSVPAHEKTATFCVSFCDEHAAPAVKPHTISKVVASVRWPQEATSKIKPSASKEAYVLDHVDLPDDNPWKRALRLGDIQFLKDGTGVAITLDGDVWLVRGLNEMNGPVKWKRFTSGLHEPMTCAIRDEQIFVFDRNGIWKLVDTNKDGEADVHELFSNAFAQTADMREFPSTLRLAPGGEFVIAKGGQEATTIGKHNGSVLRVSADGKKSTVLGYGFRQPSIGVNIRTGLVTSSDQEGQYIPSTPLHIVKDHQFYGFLSDKLPKEKYPAPIAEPLTWMPHAVNSSAMSQVWLFDAKMGTLNDQMVQICFNKPELLRVILNERGKRPQASVVSITDEFDFPPLNGSVNPADGQLYLAGFQVIGWGNTLDTLAGLCRVRHTGAPSLLPREIVPMDKGVLLRFDVALDPKKASDPASYSLGTWGYKRAHTYGSAQYKADGSTGIDWLTPSSAYVSQDGKAVFVGVPGIKPVMQMRIGWSINSADGAAMAQNAYTTPYDLVSFDAKAEGFGDITVDLTPRAATAQAKGPVTVEEGLRLSQMLGCVACHSVKDQDLFKIGPKWNKLFGSKRDYIDEKKKKGSVVVDDAYLRESILQPSAKRHADFAKSEYAMPSYAGVVTESQLESLVLYIKSLK